MTAYCTLDDVRASMDLPDTSRDAYLSSLIESACDDVDAGCGRSFGRDPASGTSTWTLDVVEPWQSSLALATRARFTDGGALDLVSVTTLEARDSESDAYETIVAGDAGYYLQPGIGPGAAGTAWPYEDVVLSPACAVRTTWPTGYRAVRITGARGFASVPRAVWLATVDWTRERYRQGPGGGPSQQGVNQFGTPILLTGAPPSVRALFALGSPYRKGSGVG